MSDFRIEVLGKKAPPPNKRRLQTIGRIAGTQSARGLLHPLARFVWFLVKPRRLSWTLGALAFVLIAFGTPHLLVSHNCTGIGTQGARCYECRYLGLQGVRSHMGQNWNCPVIAMVPVNGASCEGNWGFDEQMKRRTTMNIFETAKNKLTGEPRLVRDGSRLILTAAHRLPSSGYEELIVLRIFSVVGAAAVLVAHYRPETVLPPENNILLDHANTVIVGLANAFEKLGDVAEQKTLDVPLESLRGWLLASAVLVGGAVVRHSGLLDLYTWLTNREHVTITIDDENLTVRHGTFGFAKRIRRETISDVLILANHRTGHDVMVQHQGGLTRVASIYGDLTRPTLLRMRIREALSSAGNWQASGSGQIGSGSFGPKRFRADSQRPARE